jgi:hypothetical protein
MNKITYIEDPDTEERYREMERLGQELKVPVPSSFLKVEVFTGGNTVYAHRQRSHSWNRNAYNWFFSQFGGASALGTTFEDGALTTRETSGTIRNDNSRGIGIGTRYSSSRGIESVNTTTDNFGYRATAGTDNFSILVGTSNVPEDFNHYNLQSQFTHGSGVGQLDHAQTELPVKSWNGVTRMFAVDWVRFFNNNSGGDLDVNEVALVAGIYAPYYHSYDYGRRVMVCRDVLASPVTLPDTGQLKITYTIGLVFP